MDVYCRALLILAITLTGCGAPDMMRTQANEARFAFERDLASCRERLPPKPLMPRLRCEQEVKAAFEGAKAKAVGRSDRDLVDLLHAKERLIAERYDQGAITQTHAEAELAQVRFDVGNTVAQRDNATAMSLAEQRRASAALFMAGAKMLTPPQTINTTCRTTLGTTHCQTQ